MASKKDKQISTYDGYQVPNWDIRGVNKDGYATLVDFDKASAFVDPYQLDAVMLGFNRISMGQIVPGGTYEFGGGGLTAPGIRWAGDTDSGLALLAVGDMAGVIGGAKVTEWLASEFRVNYLTAGRVTFAGASGKLTDDAGLTYDSTTDKLTIAGTSGSQLSLENAANTATLLLDSSGVLTITTSGNSVKLPYLTAGSVLFAGTGGKINQDNANFFWDDANNRLGIGCTDPFATLEVRRTGTQLILSKDDNNAITFLGSGTGLVVNGYTNLGTGDTNFYNFRGDCSLFTVELSVYNTHSSGATSHAMLSAQTSSATADAYSLYYNGVTLWSTGMDGTDSKFKISKNATLGTNDYFTIDTSGNIFFPTGYTAGSVLYIGSSGQVSQNNASFFWDNASTFLTATGTAGKQLRLAYDSTHYVDFLLTTGSGGYDQFFQITPKTAALPNAFCGWRLQGSDFCFSYEGDDVNGFGVPNVTIRGPASSGYAASAGPGFNLLNNLSAANAKLWSMYLNDAVLTFACVNDANNVATNWLTVARSGSTAGSVNFPTFLNLGGSTFASATGSIGVTGQVLVKDGSASSPGYAFGNLSTTGFYCIPASGGDINLTIAGTTYVRYLGNEVRLSSGNAVTWATGDPTATGSDLGLSRIAAQILGVKSGSNSQEVRIHGDASKYLRLVHDGTDGTVGPSSGDLILAPTGSGIIRPPTDDAYVLGTSAKRWNAVVVSGRVDIGGSSADHSISATSVVFNEQQADVDFRIEGDSISHLIFTDATATTENIALLAAAAPNWQTMDRGVFIGDTSNAPTGNPASGGFLYSNAGAGVWRGSGGTTTTFAAAGPHCGECGADFWRVCCVNEQWGAELRECGWCGKVYKKGPKTFFHLLTDQQKSEVLNG